MSSKGNSDSAKQGWSRLLVAAIGTYGNLIKDADFKELKSASRCLRRRKRAVEEGAGALRKSKE